MSKTPFESNDIVELGWITLRSEMIDKATTRLALSLANEIDDIIAGLLINGVSAGAIHIHHHPDRVVISVGGQPRYEIKYGLTVNKETSPRV